MRSVYLHGKLYILGDPHWMSLHCLATLLPHVTGWLNCWYLTKHKSPNDKGEGRGGGWWAWTNTVMGMKEPFHSSGPSAERDPNYCVRGSPPRGPRLEMCDSDWAFVCSDSCCLLTSTESASLCVWWWLICLNIVSTDLFAKLLGPVLFKHEDLFFVKNESNVYWRFDEVLICPDATLAACLLALALFCVL